MMLVVPGAARLSLIVNGVIYPMSDGTVLFDTPDGPVYLLYIADDGLGMAQVERFSERAPAQHGETDLGFRLEPRTVSYIFAISAPPTDTSAHLETAREILIQRFRPSRNPVSFRYDRANGTVRQIDGHFTGGMQFGSADREPGTWFQRFSVDVRMPDPTWYDPTLEEFVITPVGWINPSETFQVPTPVSTQFGPTIFNADINYGFTGSWDAYPVIRINGPFRGPRISNATTDEVLDFKGAYIGAGDYLEIDLRHGLKTIIDSDGINRSGWLTEGSDLATWHLQPEGNLLYVSGTGASQDSNVTLSYYRRFVGI